MKRDSKKRKKEYEFFLPPLSISKSNIPKLHQSVLLLCPVPLNNSGLR